ncbi:MAG TPA: hypothetical protein VEL82_03055 [Thermoplasmata archaeon]|nr:hypothetical protein [Thermoplasmata archaeon]
MSLRRTATWVALALSIAVVAGIALPTVMTAMGGLASPGVSSHTTPSSPTPSFTHLQQNWGKSAYGAAPLSSCSGAPTGVNCYSLGTTLTWTAVLNVCTSSSSICSGMDQVQINMTAATALLQPGETYVGGTETVTTSPSSSPAFSTGPCTSVSAPTDCGSVPSSYTYLEWTWSSPTALNGFPQANFTYQTTLTAAGTLNDTDIAHYTVNGFSENPPAYGEVYAQPASPTMTTSVSPDSITLSSAATPSATDTATLSGGYLATGTITFYAWFSSTSAPVCTDLVFTSPPVTVSGNGAYTSAPFTPSGAGYYFFTATYSGDANNSAYTTACGADGETLTVTPATVTITTDVSPATISFSSSPTPSATDTATLSGGYQPGGSITFYAYFSSSATAVCSDLVFTSAPVAVDGNGAYTSGPFTPTEVGYYYWTASYSGDANNNPLLTPCGAEAERLAVGPASPTITTSVSPSTIALTGASTPSASDTATLTGGYQPTGSITFYVYYSSTSSPVCSDLVWASAAVPVIGNGAYTSNGFTPTEVGYYFWTAAYSGDANNTAYTTACGAADETLTVTTYTVNISTSVSPSVVMIGDSAVDVATVGSGNDPTGTLTFFAYYAVNTTANCTDLVWTSAPVSIHGDGAYDSPQFTGGAIGFYFFVVTYSGDANNSGLTTACGATGEMLQVTQCDEGVPGLGPLAVFRADA